MLFTDQINKNPSGMAVTDFDSSRSWKDLNQQALRVAHYLLRIKNLQADDHIALLIGNRVEFVEAMLGGILAGLWVTPINSHLLAEEVDYIARDSGARLLLHDHEHAPLIKSEATYEPMNMEVLSQTFLEKTKTGRDVPMPLPLSGPAGGTMLYTSGTTGKPKGVKRNKPSTLGEALQRMSAGGQAFGLNGEGPHLVTGPLYHAAPMLFALYDLLNGAPMIIMPRWNNKQFLRAVEHYRVVHTHLVPTMFVRLLNDKENAHADQKTEDLSSLTLVLHGAAPVAVSTKQKMIDWWGKILVEYWGGSEAGTTTLVNSEEWLTHPGTVGKPLNHFDVFIGNEQGNPIEAKVGQLFARHQFLEQVFEYHNDPVKTAKAHPQPFVFCIGDIGSIDDEGFVYLSDRESNMIISGGVNIYPAEIEQQLIDHPAIADVAVFGIPNHEWGEEVKAVVQLKEGIAPSPDLAEQVLAYARGKMAKFKVPRSVEFVLELPRTPTGKLLVRKLKEKQ